MLYPAGVVPRQTNRGILRKSTEKGAQATNLQAANWKRIARAAELLLEVKLYELPLLVYRFFYNA